MLLESLTDCIELLQDRARSHRDALAKGETRTRVALVDPLLRALGWDVSNPELVTPEYKIGSGWADYALLKPDGKPAAVVEAKKLGERLGDSHRSQMISYSVESGIAYAGLTNGDRWELYDVFQLSPLEEKRLLAVSIAATSAYTSALQLLLLWRPNLASGQQPVRPREPIFAAARPPDESEPTAGPETHEPSHTPTAAGSPGATKPDRIGAWVALSEYDPPRRTPAPLAIRFWDGTEQPLASWRQLFTNTADKLTAEGFLTAEKTPITLASDPGRRAGRPRSRYVVHTVSTHPEGRPFQAPHPLPGGTLFLESHVSARQARLYTRGLLQHCGLDPADVYLRITK